MKDRVESGAAGHSAGQPPALVHAPGAMGARDEIAEKDIRFAHRRAQRGPLEEAAGDRRSNQPPGAPSGRPKVGCGYRTLAGMDCCDRPDLPRPPRDRPLPDSDGPSDSALAEPCAPPVLMDETRIDRVSVSATAGTARAAQYSSTAAAAA
ncbi:MAG: hypothetical protein P8166_12140 [Candidatus Thiodiazotropha sp.]